MSSRFITMSIIIGSVLALIVWDVIVASNNTPGDTISEIMLRWARQHPAVPFTMGIIMGHLFWPQD